MGGGSGGGAGGGSGTCNASTCSGCCANGQCFPPPLNSSNNFCGTSGNACQDCGAINQRCDNATFACVPVAVACNPTTCPTGCCANGQCLPPPLNASLNFCGINGNACSDCGRIGLVCNGATFTCVPGSGGGAGGGGGTGGGVGGGTGGGVVDPCQGVPVGGQCVNSSLVRFCSIPTGSGTPSVQTYACPGGSVCQPTGAGAACVQTGQCREDDSRCSGANTIQVCTAQGTWGASQSCGGPCVPSAVGANCAISVATTALTGTLLYQDRAPRPDYADWAAPTSKPARNVFVVSQRNNQWIDATTTNPNGQFTLQVPTSPTAQDFVFFMAMGGDGLGVRYVVADPNLGNGTFSPGDRGMSPRFWGWSRQVTALANGGTTTVSTAEGSGALNLFDLLQNIFTRSIAAHQGRQGLPIAMWMGLGVEWSCGACFVDGPDIGFDSQIWMPGGSQDEGYWSDYTVAHELGHWQMASYGTSPNEGGPHILGCATFPGQAWSEGYATWHSAAMRNTRYQEDKQGGGFFWFDLTARQYFPGINPSSCPFGPNNCGIPGATQLLGQIDENAVAALLWNLTLSRTTATQEIFHAISSRHLNQAPWPRGYTRRTWDVGSGCNKTNVVNTGQPSLQLSDALDALRCGGSPAGSNSMPANLIDGATLNGTYYPYPSSSPMCRSGFCYGCLTGTNCSAGNTTAACGTGGVQCVACGTGQTCLNGVCQ